MEVELQVLLVHRSQHLHKFHIEAQWEEWEEWTNTTVWEVVEVMVVVDMVEWGLRIKETIKSMLEILTLKSQILSYYRHSLKFIPRFTRQK
jgi:hypothetical protein